MLPFINSVKIVDEKNTPPDHFTPISDDSIKILLFCRLYNLAHSGEGWSIPLVSPGGSDKTEFEVNN